MTQSGNYSGYTINKAELRLYGGRPAEQAGSFGIGSARDFVDITDLITQFTISQSIESSSISIVLGVTDGIGLLEGAPLRGEETIDFSIETHDTQTKIDLKLVVYKIDNFDVDDNQIKVSYDLHCVTSTTFASSQKEITAAFKGTSEQIALDLYKSFNAGSAPSSPQRLDENNKVFPFAASKYRNSVDNRFFYIQDGTHIHRLIIPRYRPAKALQFLASKTYSSESMSSSFRFFENLIGHYFVTDEFLLARGETRDDNIKLFYSPIGSNDPKYAEDQISRIDTLTQKTKADTPVDMYDGGYKSEVLEIDLVKRRTNLRKFDYVQDGREFTDSTGRARRTTDDPHTSEFIEDVFNFDIAKRWNIVKTYQDPGDINSTEGLQNDLHRHEILQRSTSYNYHLHSHPVMINMKGRLDITAGRVLDLDVQNFDSSQKPDGLNNQLSGRYMVHSIIHEFKDDILSTHARLSKFDWSK